jgi:formylglycine-generating enzyme required for sulfatase activity
MRGAHPSLIVLFALIAPACLPPLPEGDAPKDTGAENVPPGAPVLLLADVGTDEELVVSFSSPSVDPDGDDVTYTYTWTLDGAVRSDLTTDTVSASLTERGQTWAVTVTPNDGRSVGTAAAASATIVNTPAEVLTVTLSPESPYVTEDIVASATAQDADDDPVTRRYRWFVDGTEVQGGESDTLPAGRFAKNQRISVEVTAFDGTEDGVPFVSSDVLSVNSVPSSTGALISPTPPTEETVLTCAGLGFADADGDPEGWSTAWFVNGTEVIAPGALDGSAFDKGDTIGCAAAPFDGEETGMGVRATDVIVGNTRPAMTSVELSTYAPVEGDTLSAIPVGSDADAADTVSFRYQWFVDGAPAGNASTLPSSMFGRDDEVYVTVTPNDGTDDGTPLSSAVATVQNSTPVAASATITPSTAYTDDTLSVSINASDPDGDTIVHTYAWYVGGTLVSASATLSGASAFDRDDTVYVTVTPSDGSATGSAVTSGSITIRNSPPAAPEIALDPAEPIEGGDLTCTVEVPSDDDDADYVTYTFTWTVDGATYGGASTDATKSAVPGADVDEGEVWICSVEPDDGTDAGTNATAIVTVEGACADGAVTTLAGIDFVTVCAGTFDMGCTPGQSGCASNESPVMPVTLTNDYYVSQTEITQDQYESVMGSNPSDFSSAGGNHPVEQVSWHDAAAFANELSSAEGLTECYTCSTSVSIPLMTGTPVTTTTCAVAMSPYSCNGYRLPTEAEWEGAARCGQDLLYAGSNTVTDVAWHTGNASGITQKVSQLASNACGLYDMSGNVWEWVNDRYSSSYYSASGRTDPTGPSSGSLHVLRGGGYSSNASAVRLANREGGDPTGSSSTGGFRLVRLVP